MKSRSLVRVYFAYDEDHRRFKVADMNWLDLPYDMALAMIPSLAKIENRATLMFTP